MEICSIQKEHGHSVRYIEHIACYYAINVDCSRVVFFSSTSLGFDRARTDGAHVTINSMKRFTNRKRRGKNGEKGEKKLQNTIIQFLKSIDRKIEMYQIRATAKATWERSSNISPIQMPCVCVYASEIYSLLNGLSFVRAF